MRFFRAYFIAGLVILTFLSCSEFLNSNSLIATPYNGQTVRGIQTILITPPDDTLIDYIEVYVNYKWETRITASPYQYEWDTTLLTNGWCTVSVELYDQLGGLPLTDSIQVKVDNY